MWRRCRGGRFEQGGGGGWIGVSARGGYGVRGSVLLHVGVNFLQPCGCVLYLDLLLRRRADLRQRTLSSCTCVFDSSALLL